MGFAPSNPWAQLLCPLLLMLSWNFLRENAKGTARSAGNQWVGISKNEVKTSWKHFVPCWCQVGLEKEEAKPEIWQHLGLTLKRCFCSYSTNAVFSPALIPFLLFTCKQNHCSPFLEWVTQKLTGFIRARCFSAPGVSDLQSKGIHRQTQQDSL